MDKIEIREYRPNDYLEIVRREFDLKTFSFLPNPKISAHNLARGKAFTMVAGETIVCCGGIIPFWQGMGEAWIVTSPLVEKYSLVFVKEVHDKLKEIVKILKLERVQALVDAEHIKAQKFIERFGFINETPFGMKKYIGGRTFLRYALIKSNNIIKEK